MEFSSADSKESEEPPLEFLLNNNSDEYDDLDSKVDSDVYKPNKDVQNVVFYQPSVVYQFYQFPYSDSVSIDVTFVEDILLSFSKDPDSIEYFISMIKPPIGLGYFKS